MCVACLIHFIVHRNQETHSPQAVLDGGGLFALGGPEVSCGYKGYGLGMMVEVFCGILAGAEFGPRIRLWKDTVRIANLVSSFLFSWISGGLMLSRDLVKT